MRRYNVYCQKLVQMSRLVQPDGGKKATVFQRPNNKGSVLLPSSVALMHSRSRFSCALDLTHGLNFGY